MSDLLDINEEEVVDAKVGGRVLSFIKWWEKKRIRYNILVGMSGAPVFLMPILVNDISLYFFIGMGVAVYGSFANVLYTLGWIIEVLVVIYLKQTNGIGRYRNVLFLLGTIVSMLLSLSIALLLLYAISFA